MDACKTPLLSFLGNWNIDRYGDSQRIMFNLDIKSDVADVTSFTFSAPVLI